MKKIIVLFTCLLLPSILVRLILRMLGFTIGKKVKIGFVILISDNIRIDDFTKIGHFNIIQVDKLILNEKAYINTFNFIRGPFNLILKKRAAIGKNNVIRRSPKGVTYGMSELILGELTKITAFHFIDVTRSIRFGDFSVLAGIRSQLWTHGYVHAPEGPDRFRVDGEIIIGNNVYLGSGVLINPGITIADTINVGGNSTIAKSLTEPGMYVSQPLRYLPKSYEDIKQKLRKIEEEGLVESVYEK